MYWLLLMEVFLLMNASMACTKPVLESITVQFNFDLLRFLGRWYEIKWLSSEYHNASDIWRDYSQLFQLENNASQNLLVTGSARLLNEEKCFSFGPWLIMANDSARMILVRKNFNDSHDLNRPYLIIETDYEHYALIYACMSENYTSGNQCDDAVFWIFSRTQSLSNVYLKQLDNYIENDLCVNLTELEITPHSERSCNESISSGVNINSIKMHSCFILLILYFVLLYK